LVWEERLNYVPESEVAMWSWSISYI
jgi:hypothetical protein